MIFVGFSTTNKLLSKIIKWATKSQVSHSFFVFHIGVNKYVFDSSVFGTYIRSYDSFVKESYIVRLIPIQVSDMDLLQASYDTLNTHYDFGGLFGSLFVMIGRWFKRKIHNPFQNSKALFCSEMIVKVLQKLNYPESDKLVPHDTSPQDLLDFLNK